MMINFVYRDLINQGITIDVETKRNTMIKLLISLVYIIVVFGVLPRSSGARSRLHNAKCDRDSRKVKLHAGNRGLFKMYPLTPTSSISGSLNLEMLEYGKRVLESSSISNMRLYHGKMSIEILHELAMEGAHYNWMIRVEK